MISVCYLFEGKVANHLKKHWGKYTIGAGVAALATPELMAKYHENEMEQHADNIKKEVNEYPLLKKGLGHSFKEAQNLERHMEKHYHWKHSPYNLVNKVREEFKDK
jgi:hypothetical protein